MSVERANKNSLSTQITQLSIDILHDLIYIPVPVF